MSELGLVLLAAWLAVGMAFLVRAGASPSLRAAIRTTLVLGLAWGFAYFRERPAAMSALSWRVWLMVALSGFAVGLAWSLHFRGCKSAEICSGALADKINVFIAAAFALLLFLGPSGQHYGGAALVAVSSDAPLSERDLGLLEELRRHTPKIVLLLTKADLLTEPQRAEVLAFVRQQLRRKWETDIPVFLYSVRPEESGLKAELEQSLLFPLLRNRGEAVGQIARHKLHSLVGQTLNYLQIALAAATEAESSRQALREKLGEERGQFDLLRSELNILSGEWSASALDWALAQLEPMQAALRAKITTELREQFPRWKLRLPPMLEAWREWLGVFLTRELSEVSHSQQAMFCEPLHRARQHLTRTLRAFHDRLAAHVKAALGVSLTSREFSLEVGEPSAPPVDVAFAFDVAFTTVGWLIPLTLFRWPIERVLLRKARWEVEKNLSRVAADWRDRVATGIKELTRQAEQQALEELAALERMLEQTESRAPELRQTIQDLEGFQSWLRGSG